MRKLTSVVLRGTAVAALTVGGSLFAVASPAAAAPTQCSHSASGTRATAKCLAGTGQFRAVAYCRNGASNWNAYGPWRNTGSGTSQAVCSSGVASASGIGIR